MIYLLLYSFALLLAAHSLGISAEEADIIFSNPLYHTLYMLSPSEIVVRLPNIFVTLINIVLFYKLSRKLLKRRNDALLSAAIFALLPAVIASAVVINKAPFILFLTLVFILNYMNDRFFGYILAAVLLFVDHSFAILFLAMSFYARFVKRREWIYFAGLFIASITLFGFDVGGKPKNYFLDTFATFAAIFSPLLFLYFFYTIYRILIKERKDLVWFISATAFLFSLFLSFRQRIALIDFAPFVVLGVVLMVRTYKHSLRVRLRKYQISLRRAFWIVVGVLLINDTMFFLHKQIFFLRPTASYFAYGHYRGELLAKELHSRGIPCVESERRWRNQLRFYGIDFCPHYRLIRGEKGGDFHFSIHIGDKQLERFGVSFRNAFDLSVTKLHNETKTAK